MTYIVGVKYSGSTAIIGDMRATTGKEGHNTSLKTGLLYPGCIFGAAGNEYEIKQFVYDVGERLTGSYSIEDFAQLFKERVATYQFDPSRPFQLMLSTRHMGEPQLFVLDSTNPQLVGAGDFATLGAGKPLLDAELLTVHNDLLPKLAAEMGKQMSPRDIGICFPYTYCRWLIERSKGDDVAELERHDVGVGGLFHFIGQNATEEYWQLPAIYVHVRRGPKGRQSLDLTCYRVSYAGDALVVQHPMHGHREIYISDITHRSLRLLQGDAFQKELNRLVTEEIDPALKSQPFYIFCGFCFPYRKDRLYHPFFFTSEGNYTVQPDGSVSDGAFDMLVQMLDKTY